MIFHKDIISPLPRAQMLIGNVVFEGNNALKIYGTLNCPSGKRMNKKNRVFFGSEKEALANGSGPADIAFVQNITCGKMELFETKVDSSKNLLPFGGIVNYYGKILTAADADRYYGVLRNTIDWRNDEAVIYGKRYVTKRKVAWYGDREYDYEYSNTTKKALPWTTELLELKTLAEKISGETYNSCLLNLYHTGEEGMAWHSDAEKMLKKNGAIGSMSFGAERKFSFKHKSSGDVVSVVLEHGSLLVMKDTTQTYWLHRLPPTKKITQARINLTFRTIEKQGTKNEEPGARKESKK